MYFKIKRGPTEFVVPFSPEWSSTDGARRVALEPAASVIIDDGVARVMSASEFGGVYRAMKTHESMTWIGIPTPELAAQIERLTLYWRVIEGDDGPEEYRIDGCPVSPEDVPEVTARLAAVDLGVPDLEAEVMDACERCGWVGRLAEAQRWMAGEILDDAPVRTRQDEIEDAARALVLAADVRDEMVGLNFDTSTADAVVAEATEIITGR